MWLTVFCRPESKEKYKNPSTSENHFYNMSTSCTCHPFLTSTCIASVEENQCVSFPSLVQYNHLTTLPLSDKTVSAIWKKAFPRHIRSHGYPTWLSFQDMFDSAETKAMSEARLGVAFLRLIEREDAPGA